MRLSLASALSLVVSAASWAISAAPAPAPISASASAVASATTPDRPSFPARLVVQFPSGVWIENIVVRPNGNLLLTSLTPNGTLYEVVNPSSSSPTIINHFTISGVSGLSGIAEVAPDKYAFFGGNFTPQGGHKGSWKVWTVDFRPGGSHQPVLRGSLPNAIFLNGASNVASRPDLVLVADSTNGLVYRVCLDTGIVTVTQKFPEMSSGTDNPTVVGINGVRFYKNYLYWTNYVQHTFYKLKVLGDSSTAPGAKPVVVSTPDVSLLDDFTFDDNNDAFIVTNTGGSIVEVEPIGTSFIVAGGSDNSTIPNNTACKFGRTLSDSDVLYVTTAGDGSVGGKVVALETT